MLGGPARGPNSQILTASRPQSVSRQPRKRSTKARRWFQVEVAFKFCYSQDRVRTLKSHCDTQWSSWLAAVHDLRATVPTIEQSLDFIDDNDTTSSGCEAGQLSKAVQSFRFPFCLEFLFTIFLITDQFSNDLQSAMIDVNTA